MCKFDLVSIGLRISGINSRAKILLKIYGLNPGKLKKKNVGALFHYIWDRLPVLISWQIQIGSQILFFSIFLG